MARCIVRLRASRESLFGLHFFPCCFVSQTSLVLQHHSLQQHQCCFTTPTILARHEVLNKEAAASDLRDLAVAHCRRRRSTVLQQYRFRLLACKFRVLSRVVWSENTMMTVVSPCLRAGKPELAVDVAKRSTACVCACGECLAKSDVFYHQQ